MADLVGGVGRAEVGPTALDLPTALVLRVVKARRARGDLAEACVRGQQILRRVHLPRPTHASYLVPCVALRCNKMQRHRRTSHRRRREGHVWGKMVGVAAWEEWAAVAAER
jgi:hypothetical protein